MPAPASVVPRAVRQALAENDTSGIMSLFGTDGVRGAFGRPPIDRSTVTALAHRLALDLQKQAEKPLVVIGGDTRESTPTLLCWLRDALEAGGCTVRWAGVLPTPGIAIVTRRLQADCGICISASHNPFADNGLKLFGSDGFKWSTEAETSLGKNLQPVVLAESATVPEIEDDLAQIYLRELWTGIESEAGSRPLQGLTVALDCANGAASPFARHVFEHLGAEVHSFHDQPNGRNINQRCGSTHDSEIVRLVVETSSDLGFAFDGDADRLIAADENGRLLDGDELLYIWAGHLQETGALRPSKIVATQMSNLGLEESLEARGIELVRCDVGDRTVVREMRRQSIILGGEQSGHLVNLALSTTGDGLLSAIHFANLARHSSLVVRTEGFVRYPQVQRNIQVREKPDFQTLDGVQEIAREIELGLGESGRLLLRYSGTEPVARVMIEGRDRGLITGQAERLAERIRAEIGTI